MLLHFSYGTLQQEDVQLSTFGRLLQGQRDELLGFEQSLVRIEDPRVVATSGKTHHVNVTFNGRNDSRVSGTVYEITDAELAAADQYEQLAAYTRVAALLASGKQAWVYVNARTAPGAWGARRSLTVAAAAGQRRSAGRPAVLFRCTAPALRSDPQAEQRHPSLHLEKLIYRCFACGSQRNKLDFRAAPRGLPLHAAALTSADRYNSSAAPSLYLLSASHPEAQPRGPLPTAKNGLVSGRDQQAALFS